MLSKIKIPLPDMLVSYLSFDSLNRNIVSLFELDFSQLGLYIALELCHFEKKIL